MATTRYAVLSHGGIASPHFDLLVEPTPGADLAAWRSPAWPVAGTTDVERIRDHRRFYLNYEGDIGGLRGRVDRVAGGDCDVSVGPDGTWTVRLISGAAGTLVLRRVDGAAWVLMHEAA